VAWFKVLAVQGQKLYKIMCLGSEVTTIMKPVKLLNNETLSFLHNCENECHGQYTVQLDIKIY
jgi:hypothetical protein